MKAPAFLSLSTTIRSKSHHHSIEKRQNHQHLQIPPLPPSHLFTSTHHHAVTSRWPTITSLLCTWNDEYKSSIADEICSNNEAPSIIRCNTRDSNIHIYQMNAAALEQLFQKEQQTRHDVAGQSANDSSETYSTNCSAESSPTTILEKILNCTTAIDDTSTSMSQYYEREIYFVAVPNHTEISQNDNNILLQSTISDLEYSSSSTIIGIITVQLRHKSPLIAGPSASSTPITTNDNNDTNSDDVPSSFSCSSDLPAVTLPTPHFYICNVQVEQHFRQQGIGTSLLHVVVEYCKGYHRRVVGEQSDDGSMKKRQIDSIGSIQSSRSNIEKRKNNKMKEQLLQKLKQRQRHRRDKTTNTQCNPSLTSSDEETTIPIVLSVDTDNIPGVRLYEKFGFEYLEQNDVFCMMVLPT